MIAVPRLPARSLLPLWIATLALLAVGLAVAGGAQQAEVYDDVGETRRALDQARAEGQAARSRAEQLEGDAARVTEAAERTARESAALAARIQQAEAEIAGQEAGIALIARERSALRTRLAERQQPLIRLTAALQRLSRRPPVLALLRPGSVRDTMYMRALLETMLPEVEQRTAALRSEIERGKALEQRARSAAGQLRQSETALSTRRQSLIALETRQRLESRQATGVADREAERALALAEQARDLGTLVDDLGRAGALRAELARLPGAILRPARPEDAQVVATEAAADVAGAAPAALRGYLLPVAGRLVAGFGAETPGQPRSRGVVLAARAGAQVIAPAPGRVAFAGPYRGFGQIVIIDHAGGWTSLVTGLTQLDTRVGDSLLAGSPLGTAGPGRPQVSVELRRQGEPVNPLEYLGNP